MRKPEAVDVVIVGAGAAGGVYADRLSRAGRKVVLLEAGPPRELGDLISSSLWSRRLKWSGAPVLLEGEHPIAHNASVGDGTGGSALHHYATWPRFTPDTFRMQSIHGKGLDWGLDYEDLRPWYDEVQRDVGLSGDAEAEPWRGGGEPYPMGPLKTFRHGDLLAEGFRKLGLPVAPMPLAINSEPYKGRAACIYDSWCDAGCPIGALANPLFTYLGWALERGVELRNGAAVTHVLTDRKGRASGVRYVQDGAVREQYASVVVLAGSFIQNPRILLNSGLANSSGLLGQYLTAEAMGFAYGLFEQETEIWMGVNSGQYYSRAGFTYEDRPDLFGGLQWQIAPAAKPNDLFGVAITRPDIYGAALHEFIRAATHEMAYMVGFASTAPERANRIELDGTRRDRNGVPLARTVHTNSAATMALWQYMNARGLEIVRAAGAREAWNGPLTGGHISGGTIMGADPAKSVCDTYGRTHDIPNLLVAGAGLFPQSGGTSPTYTLHAVALRSADHLARNWRDYSR